MDGMTWPRRASVQLWTPAEKAIADAVAAVEAAGADVRLTDAVVLLQAARDSVADFVDGIDARRFVQHGTAGDGLTTGADSAGSGVPRTVNGEARDKASAASSVDPLLSAPDPPTCGSCGRDLKHDSVANGISYWRCACGNPHWFRVVAAADPALRDLSQQWQHIAPVAWIARYKFHDCAIRSFHAIRSEALQVLDEKRGSEYSGHEVVARFDYGPSRCAADLDRVCPLIEQGQGADHGED